jgi:D-glycero-D-manno-heptose 1,7-bisphosphate phosphatase
MRHRAVFLDRDGVLNEAPVVAGRPQAPSGLDELRVLPGARAACAELAAAGFLLICITNQPDIARGTVERVAVEEMNEHIRSEFGLHDVLMCPHDDVDACRCRKPRPGMLLDAAEQWDIDLARSVTVGDRWRDIAAGRAAGTRTVFIDREYSEKRPHDADLTVQELEESTGWIISLLADRGR